MERRGPSHLGPYGQACINCFKSKCRCVARPDGPGCQRCHRLKKSCEPSNPERRQNLQKKKDSDNRLAQLEAKLDSLISRLGPHEALAEDHVTDRIDDDQKSSGVSTRRNRVGRLTAQALDPESTAGSSDGFAAENEEPGSFEQDTDPYPDPAPEEDESDEIVLYTFRSRRLPHFPFVHLPPELAAHELGAERPLFFRAIICVSSRRRDRSRCRELRRALSEALLEEETDKMDLLLALMTYLTWGRDHSRIMPRLVMQAVSIACEMMHSPSTTTNPGGMNDASEVRELFLPAAQGAANPGDFLEHHRAILGCFGLSSAVSTHLNHRIDALRWTQQMGEGLAALASNRDCSTDASFARQVRLQFLAQEAMHIRQQCQLQMEQSPGRIQAPPGKTPAATALVSLETLEGELQALRASLSLSNVAATRHLAHVWATDLAINESRYAVGSMVPFMVSHFTAIATSGGSGEAGGVEPPRNGERARGLWQCVKASESCINALLTGLEDDASELCNISILQWIQLARSVDVLHYLTFRVEDPSWDRTAVPAVVDVGDMLNRVAEKFESATAAIAGEGGVDGEEFLNGTIRRIRDFCTVFKDRDLGREHQAGQDLHGHSELGGSNRDLFHIPLSDFVA